MPDTIGHRRKYPWERWFNGGEFNLVRGRDYRCATHGMMAQVRNAASARGVSVSLRLDPKGVIYVRVRH